MCSKGPIDVERVLEDAHFAVVAGELVPEHDDEMALHEPLRRERERPVETDPATEAALWERLVSGDGYRSPHETALPVAIGERARADHGTTTRQRDRALTPPDRQATRRLYRGSRRC